MNVMLRKPAFAVVLLAGLLFAACRDVSAQPVKGKSLYDRLGGMEVISAVVDDFIGIATSDRRIRDYFANTDLLRLKHDLVEQICVETGGPCTKTAHRRVQVTGDDYNSLLEDFITSLNKHKVPAREVNELLTILGPRHLEIIAD